MDISEKKHIPCTTMKMRFPEIKKKMQLKFNYVSIRNQFVIITDIFKIMWEHDFFLQLYSSIIKILTFISCNLSFILNTRFNKLKQ